MPNQNTVEYYRAREANERAVAARAGKFMVAQLHLELAEQYSKVASGEETVPSLLSCREPEFIITRDGRLSPS